MTTARRRRRFLRLSRYVARVRRFHNGPSDVPTVRIPWAWARSGRQFYRDGIGETGRSLYGWTPRVVTPRSARGAEELRVVGDEW